MNRVEKATSFEELARLVPPMLGHIPQPESVVFVPFAGGRSSGAVRADLPDLANHDHVAGELAVMLRRLQGIDHLASVVYTNGDLASAAAFIELVSAQAEIPLLVHGYVTDSLVGNFDGTPPLPIAVLGEYADEELAKSHLPAPLPDVDHATIEAELENVTVEALAYEVLPATIDRIITSGEEPAPAEIAVLAQLSSRPSHRDVALVTVVRGEAIGAEAAQAQLAWEDGVEFPQELAQIMWGAGPQPDPGRLLKALEVFRLIASAVGNRDAGALAMCGWLSWALGRSTHAEAYASDALQIDPEHGLAEILLSFTKAGHLPDWAFKR